MHGIGEAGNQPRVDVMASHYPPCTSGPWPTLTFDAAMFRVGQDSRAGSQGWPTEPLMSMCPTVKVGPPATRMRSANLR